MSFILILFILNVIVVFFDIKFDLTKDKIHSTSSLVKKELSSMDDVLFIKVYLHGDLPNELRYFQEEIKKKLNSYKLIADNNLEYEFIDPLIKYNKDQNPDDRSMKLLSNLQNEGIISRQILTNSKSKASYQIILPSIMMYYKGKKQHINLLNYDFVTQNGFKKYSTVSTEEVNYALSNFEHKFLFALKKIKLNKAENIAFLSGNDEVKLDDFKISNLVGIPALVAFPQNLSTDSNYSIDDNNLKYKYNLHQININDYKLKEMISYFSNLSDLSTKEKYIFSSRFALEESFKSIDNLSDELKISADSISFIINSISDKLRTPAIKRTIEYLKQFKVIVVPKPSKDFDSDQKLIIDQYIMNGGRVLWLIDGIKTVIDTTYLSNTYKIVKNNLNLNDMLKNYGAFVNSDLVQDLRSYDINKLQLFDDPNAISWIRNNRYFFQYPLFSSEIDNIIKQTDLIMGSMASTISYTNNNIKKTILLNTSNKSRILPTNSLISTRIPPSRSFSKSALPVAILLEGKFQSAAKKFYKNYNQIIKNGKKSKMIIISDGDMILDNVYNNSNKEFLLNAISYLCDDKSYLLKRNQSNLVLLDKDKIDKNQKSIRFLNIFFPLIIVACTTLLLIKIRKYKYAK
tara:strand:- start:359 stop:2248 length:1890 start_codon:yes stop_codon:yes gene_type:complete